MRKRTLGGPIAVTFWIVAFLTMTISLGLSVIELSSRYPQEEVPSSSGSRNTTRSGCR